MPDHDNILAEQQPPFIAPRPPISGPSGRQIANFASPQAIYVEKIDSMCILNLDLLFLSQASTLLVPNPSTLRKEIDEQDW